MYLHVVQIVCFVFRIGSHFAHIFLHAGCLFKWHTQETTPPPLTRGGLGTVGLMYLEGMVPFNHKKRNRVSKNYYFNYIINDSVISPTREIETD